MSDARLRYLQPALQGFADEDFDAVSNTFTEEGGTLTIEPVSMLPGHDYVMMFVRVRARRDDRTLDILCAEAVKLDDDGRIKELHS